MNNVTSVVVITGHIRVAQSQYGLERIFWHAKAFTTSSKSREHTHEASIDNIANEDGLLFVIWDLWKVLISCSFLKLISALATVSGSLP